MGLVDYAVARINAGNDCRILVCAKDSETGIGKTSCALDIANDIQLVLTGDEFHWSHSCIHPVKYRRFYETVPEKTVVLWDDCEKWIDNRRGMSKVNVDLGNMWATQRIRQIVTIMTFPSWADVDDRLRRYAHVKVKVEKRGLASTYTCHVNEITRQSYIKSIRLGTGIVSRHEIAKRRKYHAKFGAKLKDVEALYFDDMGKTDNFHKLHLLKVYYNDLIADEYESNFDNLPDDAEIIDCLENDIEPPFTKETKEPRKIKTKKNGNATTYIVEDDEV